MELEPGATNTITAVVDESMTADRFGNIGVQVLATPMLVSHFELAAHQLAMPALEPGQGTPHRARWASTAVPGRGRRRLRAGSVRAATNASWSTCRDSWDASPPKRADQGPPEPLAPALPAEWRQQANDRARTEYVRHLYGLDPLDPDVDNAAPAVMDNDGDAAAVGSVIR